MTNPPFARDIQYIYQAPHWVKPIGFAILNGIGPPEAVNGIDTAGEDLLLYRRITEDDTYKYPELNGVEEIWITCDFVSES